VALPGFRLPDVFLSIALAMASAAADSPLRRATDEAERSFRYQAAIGGTEAGSSGSSNLPIDSSRWAADWCRKSLASRRSPPTQRASSATRRSASRSPLGPWTINSRQPLLRCFRPNGAILYSVRPREPGSPWITNSSSRSLRKAGIVAPGESPAAIFSSYGVETPLAISASTNRSRSFRRRLSRVSDTSTSIRVWAGGTWEDLAPFRYGARFGVGLASSGACASWAAASVESPPATSRRHTRLRGAPDGGPCG